MGHMVVPMTVYHQRYQHTGGEAPSHHEGQAILKIFFPQLASLRVGVEWSNLTRGDEWLQLNRHVLLRVGVNVIPLTTAVSGE